MNTQVTSTEKQPADNAEDVSATNIIEKLSSKELAEFEKNRSARATEIILSAKTGNFTGNLKLEYWSSGRVFYCYTKDYNIIRANGQGGGNKANLTFEFFGYQYGQSMKSVSGDNLYQDGVIRDYKFGGWIGIPVGSVAIMRATFTFDKGGNDPSASASLQVNL